MSDDEIKEEKILENITNIKTQETFTLPSKGLVYTETDNIPASITLRRMTTREDKIRLRNQSEDKIRRDILQQCILDEGVDAGKLKLMDANLLLFRLRSLSLLDDTYKVKVFCDKCGTTFVHQLNLSEVPVTFLDKKDLSKLKVQLPISKQKIDFKYPSLNDMINVGEKMREYIDRFPNAERTDLLFDVTTIVYIDKVNNNKLMTEELTDWLDQLDILDSRAVRQIIMDIEKLYGFQEDIPALCPKCGSEVMHGLPITKELFSPS